MYCDFNVFVMKNALILGWGSSGKASCKLLLSQNYNVAVYDDNVVDCYLDNTLIRNVKNLPFEQIFNNLELVVVNPCVQIDHAVIKEANKLGIEVIAEIELGYRYCKGSIVAVTGTNGKTTTVSLLTHILNKAGISAQALGNIGIPFSLYAQKLSEKSVAVLEVSSFQLETTKNFLPKIAVCLNVAKDHLERHKTFDEYIRLKAKIFENQSQSEYAVLNYDDPVVKEMSKHIDAKLFYFSLQNSVNGCFVHDGKIVFCDNKNIVCNVDEVKLIGSHNLQNVLASITVAKIIGVDNDCIKSALATFQPPKYRLEYIKTIDNIKVFNDSKSTNIDSTLRACNSMSGSTSLIVGGWDKKISYDSFFASLPQNVKHIVCCGDNSDCIIECCPDDIHCSIAKCATLERAVEKALSYKDIDNLLFSPSTSSFDRYNDYVQRGKHFDTVILQIQGSVNE